METKSNQISFWEMLKSLTVFFDHVNQHDVAKVCPPQISDNKLIFAIPATNLRCAV